MKGYGKLWKVIEGHGRLWKVREGQRKVMKFKARFTLLAKHVSINRD